MNRPLLPPFRPSSFIQQSGLKVERGLLVYFWRLESLSWVPRAALAPFILRPTGLLQMILIHLGVLHSSFRTKCSLAPGVLSWVSCLDGNFLLGRGLERVSGPALSLSSQYSRGGDEALERRRSEGPQRPHYPCTLLLLPTGSEGLSGRLTRSSQCLLHLSLSFFSTCS